MISSLETPSVKDFFLMVGRGLLMLIAGFVLFKAVPAAGGDLYEGFLIDLAGLAIIYPLARRLGFDIRKTGEYLTQLRGEFRRAFVYFLFLFAVLYAAHYAYAIALAPWDLPWTNKLLFWLDTNNNPSSFDPVTSYVLGNPARVLGYVVSICIVTPLIEEFLMRRWLYVGMRKRMGALYAIALNGSFFGLLHGADFFSTAIPGFFFCWAYERTGKMETPILMHMLINTVSVVFTFGDKLGY